MREKQKRSSKKQKGKIARDLTVLVFGVAASIMLVHFGVFDFIIGKTAGSHALSAFVAGFFFTYFFTIVPATAVLGELISHGMPVWQLALIGGLGAALGDSVIFLFMQKRVTVDIEEFLTSNHYTRAKRFMKSRLFRILSPTLGAIIVASPFPDEVGLALLGLRKIRLSLIAPLTFAFNAIGILAVGGVLQSLNLF